MGRPGRRLAAGGFRLLGAGLAAWAAIGCAPSLVHYRDLGGAGRIDSTARLRATASVRIDASHHDVWHLLIRAEDWPVWHPAIRAVEVEGSLEPGRTWVWGMGRPRIRSQVVRWDPQKTLVWVGSRLHARTIQAWRLEEEEGAIRVTTEASWDGAGVSWMHGEAELRRGLEAWLSALKRQAESRPPDREVGWRRGGAEPPGQKSSLHMVY